MSIEKEISTNKLLLQLMGELEKHFTKQKINIKEHSFGALHDKVMEDILKLEMQIAPPEKKNYGMSELAIIEKLKRNPQLLEIVQGFREDE